MATTISLLSPISASLLFQGRQQPRFRTLQKFPVSTFGESRRSTTFAVKATGETSDSSLSIVKSVQSLWDKSEDRIAIAGLGFTAIVALWASTNLITAIEKLPLIPSTLELIGIFFSTWFTYRYLLFKPDREELLQTVKKSISDILGQ